MSNNKQTNFKVYALQTVSSDKMYVHWSEGLSMYIVKDGSTIRLDSEEIKQLVKALPKTIGGTWNILMGNKQSSVEWLVEKLGKYNEEIVFLYQNEIEQAKTMHKEELEFAFKGGMSLVEGHLWKPIDKFEEFYNEKFGGNK